MHDTLAANLLSAAQEMLNFAAVEENQALRDVRLAQMFDDNRAAASLLIRTSTSEDLEPLHRIGVAFRLCNEYSIAEAFYVRALDLSRETFGLNSLETSKHRNFLAGLYFAANRFDDCKNQLQQSLQMYENLLDSAHLYTHLTLFALALTCTGLGDKALAASYYRRSELKKLLDEPYAPSAKRSLLLPKIAAIAAIKYEQGLLRESIELFRFCVLQEANEAWPGNLILARVLNELSILCRSQGFRTYAAEFADMAAQIKNSIG